VNSLNPSILSVLIHHDVVYCLHCFVFKGINHTGWGNRWYISSRFNIYKTNKAHLQAAQVRYNDTFDCMFHVNVK
jgi:hypothetical protein